MSDTLDAWFEFLGDSARAYLDLFGDVGSRVAGGGYSTADWVDDGRRYWSQLAKDWAQAWRFGLDLTDEVAEQGLDASFMPPGGDRRAGRGAATAMATGAAIPAESTVVPLDGFDEADPPVCSDLHSIEAGGPAIAAANVTVTGVGLGNGAVGARLATTDTTAPPGLYVGELQVAGGARIPVQLYLSRVSGTAPA